MKKDLVKKHLQNLRRARVRARIVGTPERPRLSVFRSLLGVYAQLIDDEAGKTVVAVRSNEIDSKIDAGERRGKTATAYRVGRALAEKAQAQGITAVVFDRGSNKYHGRVAAGAEGARGGGVLG